MRKAAAGSSRRRTELFTRIAYVTRMIPGESFAFAHLTTKLGPRWFRTLSESSSRPPKYMSARPKKDEVYDTGNNLGEISYG
jgi:hypothetical protein